MSKIEQLKAEIALLVDKCDKVDRHTDSYESAYWEAALNIKYGQYVALLEAEVKDLKHEIKSDYWPYA